MNLGLIEIPSSIKKLLTFFRERRNNTGVNATTPYHQIQAIGREANIGVAITPKGNGAFTLQVPDGTTVGGNARGANAIDLQTSRTAATQVASGVGAVCMGVSNTSSGTRSVVTGGTSNNASGSNSTISGGENNGASGGTSVVCGGTTNTAGGQSSSVVGGQNNAASGPWSVIAGGHNNIANNTYTTVGGGVGNTASTGNSTVCGGSGNSASGANSFIGGGSSNTSSGNASTIPGGIGATTNSISGQVAFGHFSDALGRYQTTLTGIRQSTTGSTPVRATADAATAAATNQLTLRNNSAYIVEGSVVARDTVTNDAASFTFSVLIKRGAAAANTSIVGTPMISQDFADTAAATWGVSLVADATNGALGVNVQGAGTNAIRWMIELYAQEVN